MHSRPLPFTCRPLKETAGLRQVQVAHPSNMGTLIQLTYNTKLLSFASEIESSQLLFKCSNKCNVVMTTIFAELGKFQRSCPEAMKKITCVLVCETPVKMKMIKTENLTHCS